MTELRCQEAERLLVDYLEGELVGGQRIDVENHLRGCASCAAARREIESLRDALSRDTTPDPGTVFWDGFPERVWRAHRSAGRQATSSGLGARWPRVRAVLESILPMPGWAPAAAVLLIAIGAGYLVLRTPVVDLDAAAYQARIHTDVNLAMLARSAANELPPPSQFGFAAADSSVNYFRLGHWYAESLAYSAGGDLETARTRLTAMAAALSGVAPRLSEQLGGEPSVHNITALEARLLRVAHSGGRRDEALFHAGVWLANVALAAAASDGNALHAAAPSLPPLEHDFERAQIAPGARRDLHELSAILARETLSANDLADVRRLVRRVQAILM